jgi:hypothetical protein
MFIRKAFTIFLSVQSEATPTSRAGGYAEVPRDCVVDWRWFEDEAAAVPGAVPGRARIRPDAPQPVSGRR